MAGNIRSLAEAIDYIENHLHEKLDLDTAKLLIAEYKRTKKREDL